MGGRRRKFHKGLTGWPCGDLGLQRLLRQRLGNGSHGYGSATARGSVTARGSARARGRMWGVGSKKNLGTVDSWPSLEKAWFFSTGRFLCVFWGGGGLLGLLGGFWKFDVPRAQNLGK